MNKCCEDFVNHMKKGFEDGSDKVVVGINKCPFCKSSLSVEIDSKNRNPEHNPLELKSIDILFDQVPNHLYLARNSNADEHDRYRFYNVANMVYLKGTSAPTIKKCLLNLITILDKEGNGGK